MRPGETAIECYNLRRRTRAAVNFCAAAIAFISAGVGEWLSLVEHLVRDQGVGGSNPLSPTNYPADCKAPRDSTLLSCKDGYFLKQATLSKDLTEQIESKALELIKNRFRNATND